MEYGALNIVGGEWLIIIFVALVLILGTGKLPEAAKKLGRAAGEYKKAKAEIESQMKEVGQTVKIEGPVKSEREKLEVMAKSMGIETASLSDKELKNKIGSKMDDSSPGPVSS